MSDIETAIEDLKARCEELSNSVDALADAVRGQLSAQDRADDEWRQKGVRPVPSINNRNVFYANIIIVYTYNNAIRHIRAIIDTRLNVELVIPKHVAQQLNLKEHRRCEVSGFEEDVVNMIVYQCNSVKVQLPYCDKGTKIYKEAFLTVTAKDSPSSDNLRVFGFFNQTLSAEGNLQLDPSRPQHTGHAVAVLGIKGLFKLGVKLNPAGPELCPCLPGQEVWA